jgi:hypothetical protein
MTIAPSLDAYPVRLRPAVGESLMGYLWRFYAANGHELPSNVRTLAAQVREGRCRSVDFCWAWRVVGRQAIEELLMSESAAASAIQMRSRLAWSRWPRTSRFCPACVRERRAHLLAQDLPLVEACPMHGCVLVQQCTSCQASLCWATLGYGWRCGCGLPVGNMPTTEAPSWLRQVASKIAAAVHQGVLPDAYAELVWMTELKHRLVHGDRPTCRMTTGQQAPTRWLSKPGRWEVETAGQSEGVLARRLQRLLRRLLRDERCHVLALNGNAHVSGLVEFLARAPSNVRSRVPAIWDALAEVLRDLAVDEAMPAIVFHPRVPTEQRRRIDVDLQAWWLGAWPFAGEVAEGRLAAGRIVLHHGRIGDLIAQLVDNFARLARCPYWSAGGSALVARWRPCTTVSCAGDSVAHLVRALAQLHPAELGFVAALAEEDLACRGGCGQ